MHLNQDRLSVAPENQIIPLLPKHFSILTMIVCEI
jgi:hypothetical protein